MSGTQEPGRSRDWVFALGGNCHVTNDRAWFTSYTPFFSEVNVLTGNTIPVLGIGHVSIPVKRSPNLYGVKNYGTLELDNVLHIPTYYCNIIGTPLLDDGFTFDSYGGRQQKSKGTIRDGRGRNAAFFTRSHSMFAIEMRGPPTGPLLKQSVFKKPGQNTICLSLSCQWPEHEKKKWEEFKKGNGGRMAGYNPGLDWDDLDYSAQEKEFLKKHFKNEYNFLRQHGLNIYKEDHRDEGRQILRALMSESSGNYEIML